jgi:hypothetical protein
VSKLADTRFSDDLAVLNPTFNWCPESPPQPTPDAAIPTQAEREALKAALLAEGTETGFWDDDGRPILWPDDIEQ